MTTVQLEYAVALDIYRSFVMAAEKSFVTQPTLSMQIQKLEDELEVKLFDRSQLPISPTPIGTMILDQARLVLKENARIREIIADYKKEVRGILRVGIIPTLAPYLLPPLVGRFTTEHPAVKLEIWEYPTDEIIDQLKKGQLDCGILSTPLDDKLLHETPLFYENFVVYTSADHKLAQKKVISTDELPHSDILLMNEKHCMRNQVLNICSRRETRRAVKNLEYNTGSVETLKRLVDLNAGWTILPELSVMDMSSRQLDMVRYFRSPEPVREISLVTNHLFVKNGLMEALKEDILKQIPDKMKAKHNKKVVSLHKSQTSSGKD